MKTLLIKTILIGILFSVTSFAQWTSAGLTGRWVHSFAAVDNYIFAGTDNQIFRSSNMGADWEQVTQPFPFYNEYYVAETNNVLIAFSYGRGTANSTDYGQTWTELSQVPSQFNAFKVIGETVYGGQFLGAFRSTANGANWEQMNFTVEFDARSFSLSGNDLFIGTWDNGIFKTTDNGQSWDHLTQGLSSQNVPEVFAKGNIIIAGSRDNHGIDRSTDYGQTWISDGTTQVISSIIEVEGNLFASSTIGQIIRSTDYGVSWTIENDGFGGLGSNLDIINGYLFAGSSFNGGAWKRSLSDFGITNIDESSNLKPDEFSLSQNYPNPFNPSTTIIYNIMEDGFISLKVYDILGREVVTLENGFKNRGNYKVNFNALNLTSGTYIYELKSKNIRIAKTMILLK